MEQKGQSIEELRNNLVDYTDFTPNEKRYDKNNSLDLVIFYPLGNMYPYKKGICRLPFLFGRFKHGKAFKVEIFWDGLYKQQIEYAIKYLQIAALKKFMVKNKVNMLLSNPFHHLLRTHYPIGNNLEAVKEIIRILIENYDEHYNMISQLPDYMEPDQQYILDLINSILPNDRNNECSLCLHTQPKHLLINPCLCKTPVHTNCLVEISPRKNPKCGVCLNDYKINEPVFRTMSGAVINEIVDDSIFFPYHDLYYKPLMGRSALRKVCGIDRLTMAIIYLQIGRVRELYKMMKY